MKKNSIIALALGGLMGVAALAPAEAMPVTNPVVKQSTDVQQARVVIRYGYYRGYRGYRARRPGWRFYGGYWYPPVAFGPVIVAPRRGWAWCGPRWRRHRC